jgi:hypothetical protein
MRRPHLLAAKPASGHEGEDGEREGDGEDVGVDALEHLLDEQREDRGIDGDQIGKGDGEQAPDREQQLEDCDGHSRRQHDGEEERSSEACSGDGDDEQEDQRQREPRPFRQHSPLLSHEPAPRFARALA